MTCQDHTTAWLRLKRSVLCTDCGTCRSDCACRPSMLRDRFGALWRRLRRKGRRDAAIQRKMARLRAEISALEAKIDAEVARRRQAEADLAAERYTRAALLETMTPGVRRGRA